MNLPQLISDEKGEHHRLLEDSGCLDLNLAFLNASQRDFYDLRARNPHFLFTAQVDKKEVV